MSLRRFPYTRLGDEPPTEPHGEIGTTMSSRNYMPGQGVALVRPKSYGGPTNYEDHGSSLRPQKDEKEIPEELAVCRFCFVLFKEADKVLKMKYRCSDTLTHEECVVNWSRKKGNTNCDRCGQENQSFPVTLFWGFKSSQRIDKEGTKKRWPFSWLTK